MSTSTRTTFTRPQPDPSPEVLYGRRILNEVAALVRDGAVGGSDHEFTTREAAVIRAEIAGWFDYLADRLKNVRPQ